MTLGKILVLLMALALPATAAAEQGSYQAGVHYRELAQRLPSAGGETGKVEVIEFFWYGCPHCYELEPYIEQWRESGMPAEATFVRMPAALNDSWRNHARAYYVAEALGVVEKIHRPLFDAMHQGGQRLADPESVRALFVSQGVDGSAFDGAWRSYAVDTQVRRADSLARAAGISGVPAMIVGGRYEATVTLAGGREELLSLVNYLVAKESKPDSQEQ